METIEILDTARAIIALGVMAYAAVSDIRTRRVSNMAWLVLGGAGLIILITHIAMIGIDWKILIFTPVFIILVYILYRLRLIYGGADAKSLMSLAIVFPLWPKIAAGAIPLWPSLFPFVFIVLLNSLLPLMLMPLLLLIYNLATGARELRFPHALIGFRANPKRIGGRFLWPMEMLEEGKRVSTTGLQEKPDLETTLQDFERAGVTRIWVTPKIPLILFIAGGLLITLTLGDMLSWLILSQMHLSP